jgi:hypothetical protein
MTVNERKGATLENSKCSMVDTMLARAYRAFEREEVGSCLKNIELSFYKMKRALGLGM